MMTDAPRAYLHEPCGILATAEWWREHRGVCDGCETAEGWSPLFSDTDLVGPDALDSLPIAALLHARLASWFGDGRQSFLVSDLVPVVTQIVADHRAAFYRVLERCEELKTSVAEHQWNALEMARKADQAERRAEEAEFHVEQLRDTRDGAERRIERAERLLDGWEQDGPDDAAIHLLIQRVREALNGGVGT